MQNNRETPTKEVIRQAFLTLMREKPFNRIRVSDIAKLACVARKTFYFHYRDIHDLVGDCFHKYLYTDFHKSSYDSPEALVDDVIARYTRIFDFCQNNVAFAKLAFEEAVLSRYLSRIRDHETDVMKRSIKDAQPPDSKVRGLLQPDTVSQLAFEAECIVIREWLSTGMTESMTEAACKIAYLTFHLSDVYSATDGACAEYKRLTLDAAIKDRENEGR